MSPLCWTIYCDRYHLFRASVACSARSTFPNEPIGLIPDLVFRASSTARLVCSAFAIHHTLVASSHIPLTPYAHIQYYTHQHHLSYHTKTHPTTCLANLVVQQQRLAAQSPPRLVPLLQLPSKHDKPAQLPPRHRNSSRHLLRKQVAKALVSLARWPAPQRKSISPLHGQPAGAQKKKKNTPISADLCPLVPQWCRSRFLDRSRNWRILRRR